MLRVLAASEEQEKEIESQTLPNLLFYYHQNRALGRLVVRGAEVEKRLYLQGGAVIFAASTDRDERFMQRRLRHGNVPLPHLLRALEISLRTHYLLGEFLVSRGQLTSEQAVGAVQEQIKDIVCSTFQWADRTWEFQNGVAPGPENITLPFAPTAWI